jgi:uncharacterized DUF497 family protein
MDIEFKWDHGKARSNERKHGVSFEEAVTVFIDENAILIQTPIIRMTKIGFFSSV